jgi:hypothetical protein
MPPDGHRLDAGVPSLGIEPALTSDHHPTGHADTERMRRTQPEACLWLPEWPCPFPVASALERWIAGDNEHDWHSALGSKSPRPFEREYPRSHSTPFVAAGQLGSIIGYWLQEGEYQRLLPGAEGQFVSQVLGLELRLENGRLQVFNPATGERLLTLAEALAARRTAEAELQQLQAELARLRGESAAPQG